MHQNEDNLLMTDDDDGRACWSPRALGPLCYAIWGSTLHSDCEESWCECNCHIAAKFLKGVSETVYVKAGNVPGYIPYFHHLLVSGYADDSDEANGTYTINLAQIDRASYQPVHNVTNIILEYLTEETQEEAK